LIFYKKPAVVKSVKYSAGYPVSGLPDIWYLYPAFGLAGYPAKIVSGAFLILT
jgi:hypothetical protein